MKKSIITLLFFTVSLLFTSEIMAQKFSGLDKSPMDASTYPSSHRNSEKIVKVIYSRPQLKGRKLSRLVKNGKIWRTGANETVEITFYKDVTFGGEEVKAGTYSLLTIPNEKEWTIILNKQINTWGAYYYKKSEDVIRVKGSISTIKKPIEVFSIGFDKEKKEESFSMYLGWENVVVSVPIKEIKEVPKKE